MNILKYATGLFLALVLVACGGGGGDPGGTNKSSGGNPASNPSETVTTTVDGSVALDLLNGAAISTNSISAVEIAQVRAVVKDPAGAPVAGIVVTFSEAGVGLIKFAPLSQTAMTNGAGVAVIEVRAADLTKTGATSISVTASVSKKTITAVKTLEITNAPPGGPIVDPQTLASAINFISTDPADKAIVLKGAGGNGRSETGILKFRVVDKNNTPVQGVLVDFVVNPSADVVLNIAQGKTDADGMVITTVSSKLVPTAVVVNATVNGKSITSQSDSLKVTTGVGIQAGFEILPLVYNLDGALSGDSTPVTARLVDVNGNPVADGVPVVFVTTGGAIGTSAQGACNTSNGECSVTFRVQNPRPSNGIVTIKGSAKVGTGTTLLGQIDLNMSSAPIGVYEPAAGVPAAPLVAPTSVTTLAFARPCDGFSKQYMVANSQGYSAPAGTTVSAEGDQATGLGASIAGANTVLDVGNFGPSLFNVRFDPSAAKSPSCNPNGIDSKQASVKLTTNASKSKRENSQFVSVTYPVGDLSLLKPNTANTPATITIGACGAYERTEIQVIGSDGLTLPAGAIFNVSSSDNTADVGVYAADPGAAVAPPLKGQDTLLSASNNASRKSMWFVVKAPASGAKACATGNKEGTFDLLVTVNVAGRLNTQKVTVTYPIGNL